MPTAKPIAPFKKALEAVMPAAGPAFQTGALGGPEGLGEPAMRMYNVLRTIAEGMQADPMGGLQPMPLAAPLAEVVGPARGMIQELLPAKVFAALERDPRRIYAGTSPRMVAENPAAYAESGTPGQFKVPSPRMPGLPQYRADLLAAAKADPRIEHAMLFDTSSRSLPILRDSAIHEALHTLLHRKGGPYQPFLPEWAEDPLVRKAITLGQYPKKRYETFGPGEPGIEVMTHNVLKRAMPQEPSKLEHLREITPLTEAFREFVLRRLKLPWTPQ